MSEQLTGTLIIVLKCLIAILAGVLEGNGAVYVFNTAPVRWFCDYGEEPDEKKLAEHRRRIRASPWKFLFSMLFIAVNIKMAVEDWQFALAASAAIMLLLMLSLSDIKYRIVPDQLLILLTICGLGFIPFHFSLKECLLGAAVGFGLMALVALLGKLTFRRESLGGGDIKLFTVLGFICGPLGVALIAAGTAFISAGHLVLLLATGKIKRSDTVPMVPYIALVSAVYMVFFFGRFGGILL